MTKREFVLDYINRHKFMSSWDWDADIAYAAKFFPEKYELGKDLLASDAVDPVRIAVHKSQFGPVKRDRLKISQGLVQEGLLKASWVGSGYDGKRLFNITRTRSYEITADGLVELRILSGI